MSAASLVRRFRIFLLATAGGICVGAMVELWLEEHTGSAVQWIPFILCGMGIGVIMAALIAPQRWALLALRIVMVVVLLGSLLGIYEHYEHNLEFALEIRPNAVASEVLGHGLKGANPLLAPGILALVAILSMGATYCHPALNRHESGTRT